MKKSTAEFYKRMTPICILIFIVGTFIYGGMSTWAISKRGFSCTSIEYLIYGYGYLMMLISWVYSYLTIKAWRYE